MVDNCATCLGEVESADHILRRCCKAKEVWEFFTTTANRRRWRNLNFRSWIMENISARNEEAEGENWPCKFAIIVWWIWRWRCDKVFIGRETPAHHKARWITEAQREIETAFARHNASMATSEQRSIRQLRWEASTEHRFTLNVDGSVKTGINKAGWGGVLRNDRGEWIEGVAGSTHYGDPSLVEAWAIAEGLKWVWLRGIRDVEVQSDAKNILQWLHDDSTGRGPMCQCIEEIKQWMNKDWRISLRVIYREQNSVADCLASFGAVQRDGMRVFIECPVVSEDAYFEDKAHVVRARRVVEQQDC